MSYETVLLLLALCFGLTWSPGPNNAMLAASGANYGVRRTVPHAFGVALGFPVMLFLVALGLGEIYQRFPAAETILKYVGAALLVWIAWRIFNAGRSNAEGQEGRPFTFAEAMAFQWVNPKAWAMAISLVAQFVSADAPVRTALICAACALAAGMTSAFSWAALGAGIQRVLRTEARLRVFNGLMAFLILGTIILLFA